MRIRNVVIVLAVVALVATAGLYVALHRLGDGLGRQLRVEACTVAVSGEQVTLQPPQMANAATIAAVGIRRGLPTRAVTVALATALQESKLENLSAGDRDSVGLFQQRPSQGWGSAEKIADPRYASNAFYSALLKVHGWQAMTVTDAAQAVQRSAHPDAYQRWADDAAAVAQALHGDADAAVACTYRGKPARHGRAATDALAQQLRLDWGDGLETTVAGATTLALAAADEQSGWQYAHWLVSQARDHGIKRVRYLDRSWSAGDGGWTKLSGDKAGTPSATEKVTAEVWG